jgi:Domain of unknown function (DUF4375)
MIIFAAVGLTVLYSVSALWANRKTEAQQDPAVTSILDQADDFALCDNLFGRILDQHENNPGYTNLTNHERVVVAVWGTAGLIGNGGFNLLLEGYYANDPTYTIALESYREIGATDAQRAFQLFLSHFPARIVPGDWNQRFAIYDQIPEVERDRIDLLVHRSEKESERLLAAFIRAHRAQFK